MGFKAKVGVCRAPVARPPKAPALLLGSILIPATLAHKRGRGFEELPNSCSGQQPLWLDSSSEEPLRAALQKLLPGPDLLLAECKPED